PFCSLSFSVFIDHPHLASCPTRRSSDLVHQQEDRQKEEEKHIGREDHVGAPGSVTNDHTNGHLRVIAHVLHRVARVEVTGVYQQDRKSTRLNSSHVKISYAVFCLKKKTY